MGSSESRLSQVKCYHGHKRTYGAPSTFQACRDIRLMELTSHAEFISLRFAHHVVLNWNFTV